MELKETLSSVLVAITWAPFLTDVRMSPELLAEHTRDYRLLTDENGEPCEPCPDCGTLTKWTGTDYVHIDRAGYPVQVPHCFLTQIDGCAP